MNDFEKILTNQILPLVAKPGRYMGNELNVIKKDWSKVHVYFALIFPDLYELGMSYIGFEILYHILNRESNIVAERVYAPGIDLEKRLRDKGLPLFSLETKRPLVDFDVLGFTLQYELHYTNVLNILDLGGVSVTASDRKDEEPIVLGGGPCAFNPEPLTDFFDAFLIGDGEAAIFEIARCIEDGKIKKKNRQQILKGLAQITGVYVPQFYKNINTQIQPILDGIPPKIQTRTIDHLDDQNYPDKPLIPLIETTHDRYAIEIMRGCTRGCRFCNAGIIYRPVRERPVHGLLSKAVKVLKNTGYEEISLVSLSTSDYSQLRELLSKLNHALSKEVINISFPSLRAETFTPELAKFAKSVRKSGITLAPEAGSQYLRDVINKNNTNEDLTRAVTLAFDEGWNLIKLYFMIGLPGEKDDDLEGIVSLINDLVHIAKMYKSKNINVSISPFVPKPHTPFQWAAQNSVAEMNRKINFLRQRIKSNRVDLSWREPEVSYLEVVLGRGDRRINQVIKKAWELGAKFDAWSDKFRFDLWSEAFRQTGIDPAEYSRERQLDEHLPWDHIKKGVTKNFLKAEFKKALNREVTPDCKTASCVACGLMSHEICQQIIHGKTKEDKPDSAALAYGRTKKLIKSTIQPTVQHIRLKYQKTERMRFISHLDTIRIFERTFRRSALQLVYTQGFHPHPRISFGPPLTFGYLSVAEYLDVQIIRERDISIRDELNHHLPAGIEIIGSKIMIGKYDSLVSLINKAEYTIVLLKTFDQFYLKQQIDEFSSRPEIWIDRAKKGTTQKIDIKPFIDQIRIADNSNSLVLSLHIIEGRTARIDEILHKLFAYTEEDIALSQITRTGLLIKKGEATLTPLDV